MNLLDRAMLTLLGPFHVKREPDPPCRCEKPATWYIYDANSYRRWCGRCRGRLHQL